MTPVIPPVGLEILPELPFDLLVGPYLRRGTVEYRIRAHLHGHELLDDVVSAHGRERQCSRPEEEARRVNPRFHMGITDDDLLAGREDHLLRRGRRRLFASSVRRGRGRLATAFVAAAFVAAAFAAAAFVAAAAAAAAAAAPAPDGRRRRRRRRRHWGSKQRSHATRRTIEAMIPAKRQHHGAAAAVRSR